MAVFFKVTVIIQNIFFETIEKLVTHYQLILTNILISSINHNVPKIFKF